MNSMLEKEPVKRAEKSIKEFDPSLKIVCLEQIARTAQDAATALGCSVGAIVKSLLFSVGDNFVRKCLGHKNNNGWLSFHCLS